ncbi:MAG: hypothetical protein GF411_20535 [Candidatus Lokiarchaeota archaeon]|nr:hypothetical protein [Candidatus Lokiarchaeota archaeon]
MPSNIKVRKKTTRKNNSTDINLLVNTETDDVYFEWDRHKIVNALREEGGVGERTAKNIAKSVEQRVMDSGIKKITTSLIRELVDNELFELGYQKKLEKQASISLPKSDIEELIFSKSQENSNIGTNNPEAIQFSLSETALKQYALQEVFSEEVAEAHRTGKVHVHDLGHPTRIYAFSKDTKLIVKIDGDIREMTLEELYDCVDGISLQINETQHTKECSHSDMFVLDRNDWVKLNRVIFSDEVKDMVEFSVGGHIVKVTSDHGCVVKRNNRVIITRADEVKNTDEFMYVMKESVDGNMPNMQEKI